jgi:hypothetical protein
VGQGAFHSELENEILKGLRPSINPLIRNDLKLDDTENFCPLPFAHIIDECLSLDPLSRPTAKEVLLISGEYMLVYLKHYIFAGP